MRRQGTSGPSHATLSPPRRGGWGRAGAWPIGLVLMLVGLNGAVGQEEVPIFRLEVDEPTSRVTGLAFAPEDRNDPGGQTLYIAGWDKIVRVWTFDQKTKRFQPNRNATYRVPIGPGLDGAISSLALSSDGRWLALAGQGYIRGSAGFRQPGEVVPWKLLSKEMKEDRGQIVVFDTRSKDRRVLPLRGHLAPVDALALAPVEPERPLVLASVALEGEEGKEQGVVRVWDVEHGKPLAPALELTKYDDKFRPSLGVRRRGPGPADYEVAITFGGSDFYLRDVAGQLVKVEDGNQLYNNTIALDWFGPNRLVTVGYVGKKTGSLLKFWDRAGKGADLRMFPHPIKFPVAADGRSFDFPYALALFASPGPPGRAPDHAAVVLGRLPLNGAPSRIEYSLQIRPLDLDPARANKIRARVRLGDEAADNAPQPVLAVAPDGKHLAVAFRRNHEVAIYDVAGLLDGQRTPLRPPLPSPGLTFPQAAFVRKGKDWGLLLDERPKGRPGELLLRGVGPGRRFVLDLKTGRVTDRADGWTTSVPALNGYQTSHNDRKLDARGKPELPASVNVWRDGKVKQVPLKLGDTLTDYALSPPGPGSVRGLPVLAIAAVGRSGVPRLELFNGSTGDRVRVLSGHTAAIRSLAFSADGRRLVSASEDQTVSIWNLSELESELKEMIRLEGVELSPCSGGVIGFIVEAVDPEKPASKVLREGDRLTALVQDGKFPGLRFPTLGALDQAILANPPGALVMLWRERDRAEPKYVKVKVVQAVDERKPFLTMFFASSGKADGMPHWLAWKPEGNYDLSDPAADEDLLGWHFNTDQPEAPTRFAVAAEYRRLRQIGLLDELFHQKDPPPPPPPPPPLRPDDLFLDPLPVGYDDQWRALLQQPPRALTLMIHDDKFPLRDITSVDWSLDGGNLEPMRRTADRVWTTDFLGRQIEPWRDYVAKIVLRTSEPPTQDKVELKFLFKPEPPTIEVDPRQDRVVVKEEQYTVSAEIQGARAGEKLRVRLRHGAGPEQVLDGPSPRPIQEKIALQLGDNRIELEARLADVPPRDAERETTRKTLLVVFEKPQAPTIELKKVVPLTAAGEGSALTPLPDDPLAFVADGPRVRLEGRIQGDVILNEAWLVEGAAPAKPRHLKGFKPGKDKSFDFAEELKLVPDTKPLLIRIKARAGVGEPAELALGVRYQPPVPEIVEIGLKPADREVFDGLDGAPPRVRLVARLKLPPDNQPFQPEILRNGTVLPEHPEFKPDKFKPDQGEVSAGLTPEPGDNRIQLRLSNIWGTTLSSEAIEVRYMRPPLVSKVTVDKIGNQPFADLTARVDPVVPEPKETQITLDRPGKIGQGQVSEETERPTFRREADHWVLSARRRRLEPGKNRFLVKVRNRDGWSRATAASEVVEYREPPKDRPVVRITSPDRDFKSQVSRLEVGFQVRSKHPLKEVKLVQRNQTGRSKDVFHAQAPQGELIAGYLERKGIGVELFDGKNIFDLYAVDDQGEGNRDQVVGEYLQPPVEVVIDSLVVFKAAPGQRREFKPAIKNNLPVFDETLPDSWVKLQGRVRWLDADARKKYPDPNIVEVWVNGTTWSKIKLPKNNKLEDEFSALVRLSTKTSKLTVRLAKAPMDRLSSVSFVVPCEFKDLHQELHLLVISAEDGDVKQLRARIERAFKLERIQGNNTPAVRFKAKAFEKVFLYGPLVGRKAELSLINGQLWEINKNLGKPNEIPVGELPTEVVAIFFQGSKPLMGAGRELLLRTGKRFPLSEFSSWLDGTRGYQIFLLEVKGPPLRNQVEERKQENIPVRLSVSWNDPGGGQGGAPPPGYSFIEVLEKSLTRTRAETTVQQLDQALSREYLPLQPNVQYSRFLPKELEGLIISKP
jgi:WD40 repeat protein